MSGGPNASPRWAKRLGVAALMASVPFPACSSDELETPGRVRFETEHVRYWAVDGRDPCTLTAYWLERFHQSVSGYLGLSADPSDKIDYHWVTEDDIIRICGTNVSGCAFGRRVYSVFPQYRHELVHAIVHRSGTPPDFVSEGLAEMLGCTYSDAGDRLDKTDVLPLLTRDFFTIPRSTVSHARALARSFVRFLIESYGTPAFLRFYASMPLHTDFNGFEQRFRESFATPLNEVLARWTAIAERSDEACLFLTECEEAASTGDVTVLTGCGPLADPKALSTTISFSVDELGLVQLVADLPDPVEAQPMLSVHRCFGGNAGLVRLGIPQLRLLRTPPGRYFASIVSTDSVASVNLSVTPVRPPEAGSCTLSAEPLPLVTGRPIVVTRRWVQPGCAGQPWCPGESVDLAVESSGLFVAGRAAASIPPEEAPATLYQCTEACPLDAAESCTTDWLVSAVMVDTTPRIIGQRPVPGDILHVATGPAKNPDAPYIIQYALVSE